MTRVALLVGGGISNEIVAPVLDIIAAAGARIEWDRVDVVPTNEADLDSLLDEAVAAVERCKVGLKTRFFAPQDRERREEDAPGTRNPNIRLRRRLDLYAGALPIRPLPGIQTRFEGVDLLLIRENTEDIYKGIEHEIVPGVVESLKVVTREACERITRFAFGATRTLGREHLTFIHKANIMKMSDGLFLDTVREIAAENPDIPLREMIVDAACMQLVLNPYQFDVLLTGNLYGDLLGNLGSGLAGGISSALAINIGEEFRVYEAVHGDAAHLEGTGTANPLPLLSPALELLRHLGEEAAAERILAATTQVLRAGENVTEDLGGQASTAAMADAIVAAI